MRKDSAAAFRYLSPKSFACYNVYRPEDAPRAGSPAEAGRLIQERMKLVGDWAGTGSRLEDILIAVEPHHPDLKLVKHDEAAAYSIVAIPDSMGDGGRLRAVEAGRDAEVRSRGTPDVRPVLCGQPAAQASRRRGGRALDGLGQGGPGLEGRLLHGDHAVAFVCLWRTFGNAAVFLSLVYAPAMGAPY